MKNAIISFQNKENNLHKAAEIFDVPYSTLCRKIEDLKNGKSMDDVCKKGNNIMISLSIKNIVQ